MHHRYPPARARTIARRHLLHAICSHGSARVTVGLGCHGGRGLAEIGGSRGGDPNRPGPSNRGLEHNASGAGGLGVGAGDVDGRLDIDLQQPPAVLGGGGVVSGGLDVRPRQPLFSPWCARFRCASFDLTLAGPPVWFEPSAPGP